MKKLRERKNSLVEKMTAILDKVENENRSMTEDEAAEYAAAEADLQNTINLIDKKEALRSMNIGEGSDEGADEGDGEGSDEGADEGGDEGDDDEVRAFVDHIRGNATESQRAENLTFGDNGAVVPKTIAKRVIKTLENICPIYERATKFHFKGEVTFPVLDETNGTVVCDFAEEFNELTSKTPSFGGVTLKGYLVGALALISRSLINNAEVDVVSIIISTMALAAKRFLEKQCLLGTEGKMQGVLETENTVTSAAASAITIDELISLQGKIIDQYQEGCIFIMHPETRDELRKLKDKNGQYYFTCDVTTGFKPMILNKQVYVSDAMPKIGAGNKAVFYGDPSGLYINLREQISTQVLREKYATMHAIGINMWFEIDSKIAETQKLAALACASV